MWSISFHIPAHAAGAFSDHLEEDALALSSFEVLDDDGRQIGDQWQIDILRAEKPDRVTLVAQLALIAATVNVPVPSFKMASLPETDWVAETLSSFAPMSFGRFWVHGSHDAGSVPPGKLSLRVDAATAFGTGEHATTRGCLLALDGLAKRRASRRLIAASAPYAVLDVGCGTGILALAAAKLWRCRVLASDIDPEAVRVARRTTQANDLSPRVRIVAATGVRSRTIAQSAPYAVITANILARPLCHLARDMAALLTPGGRIILSGLLANQVPMVLNAYRAQRLVLEQTINIGEWATLILRRPAEALQLPNWPLSFGAS
ncbi:MAG: methyltransferase domain-containing protein [Alphaproteobacteria bacterium]|nr:methyltransferase domain-containing protein [Alphaproteobacteria bacterium]